MATWANIEWEDGREERIPLLNGERIDVEDYVLSMEVHREWIRKREQLRERRYRAGDIEGVIQNLRQGDKVRVTTHPKSYPDQILTIEKGGDEAEGYNADGEGFYLIPTFWGKNRQGDGQPWMRTVDGWDSRGEIEEVEILSLA